MKNATLFFLTIALIFFLLGCSDNEELLPNCPFVHNPNDKDETLNETERAIMDECIRNEILDSVDLVENLIGEWSLIGFESEWKIESSKPCAQISISNTQLILDYQDEYMDTSTFHTWKIVDSQGKSILRIDPPLEPHLHISTISPEFMFGVGTSYDAAMYLYKKEF